MQLLYLILGFLFATIGVTFLDSISTILTYITELIKAKISVKIAEYNSKITELTKDQEEVQQSMVNVIGFQTPISEETYTDEDED